MMRAKGVFFMSYLEPVVFGRLKGEKVADFHKSNVRMEVSDDGLTVAVLTQDELLIFERNSQTNLF